MKNIIKFKKSINSRNKREWLSCLIVIPVFVYKAIIEETLISKIMNLEISIAAVFIAYYIFIKSHKNINEKEISQENLKGLVEKEINLLMNVKYWYILPVFLGLLGLSLEQLYIDYNNSSSLTGGLTYLTIVFLTAFIIKYLNEVKGVKELRSYLLKSD